MLGINTYGLSHLLNKDFDGTIVKLKKMGVTSLEPCVVMSDAFGMLRRIIYGIGFGLSGMVGGNWYGERAYYKAIDRTEKLGVDVLSVHCALCDVSPRILDRMIPHALDMFILRRIANFVVSLNIKSKEEADSYIPILERFIELMTPAGGKGGLSQSRLRNEERRARLSDVVRSSARARTRRGLGDVRGRRSDRSGGKVRRAVENASSQGFCEYDRSQIVRTHRRRHTSARRFDRVRRQPQRSARYRPGQK